MKGIKLLNFELIIFFLASIPFVIYLLKKHLKIKWIKFLIFFLSIEFCLLFVSYYFWMFFLVQWD